MAHMDGGPLTAQRIATEMQVLLEKDSEVHRGTVAFARQVAAYWKSLAPDAGDIAPSGQSAATGAYKNAIDVWSYEGRHAAGTTNKLGKKIGGQIYYTHRVICDVPYAGLVEEGTGPDDAPNYPKPPNAGGHWHDLAGELHNWWNTPTEARHYAAKTALHFQGTGPDGFGDD